MEKTPESVIAMAQFSLSGLHLEHARKLLKSESDWQGWVTHVEQHGLSGFANKHVKQHDLPVPTNVLMSLKALNVRHAAAAKARYESLRQIHEVFQSENIPFIALKGAALMPYLYGEAALRPMRDMDLLLPRSLETKAADCLRQIGFDLPHEQPSQFMRDMHQLPNATKTIDGFVSSVELHRDGISREVTGHFYYPEDAGDQQTIKWNDLEFQALEDFKMIHQVSRHLEGLHPKAHLKLINVMDVIGLAEMIHEKGQWAQLKAQYPHVINTLRCLHLLTPLPATLQAELAPMPSKVPDGVGQIMVSMRTALLTKGTLRQKLRPMLSPSDWWLYLYYNVDPDKSLLWIKAVRHPLRVTNWLLRRLYSRILGG